MSGIDRPQKVLSLFAADLAQNNPVRPHVQYRDQQVLDADIGLAPDPRAAIRSTLLACGDCKSAASSIRIGCSCSGLRATALRRAFLAARQSGRANHRDLAVDPLRIGSGDLEGVAVKPRNLVPLNLAANLLDPGFAGTVDGAISHIAALESGRKRGVSN